MAGDMGMGIPFEWYGEAVAAVAAAAPPPEDELEAAGAPARLGLLGGRGRLSSTTTPKMKG